MKDLNCNAKEELIDDFYSKLEDLKTHIQEKEPIEANFSNALDLYQHLASKTATYDEGLFTLTYVVSKLAGEAGEVCEKFGKLIRDKGLYKTIDVEIDGKIIKAYYPDHSVMDDYVKQELSKELGDVLWYIARISTVLGIDLSHVAAQNLDKLGSRLQRNMLGGSGDNR